MKLKFFVAIPLALMFTACDKQEDKFAGFTAVGTHKKTARFYIDTNTVTRNRSGWVSFNMVREMTDGYVIQNAETNCDSRFTSLEGVKYRQDGTSQEKFASETLALPADKEHPDETALVKMACDKAEEYRMITGAFDDNKALELLKNLDPLANTLNLLESKDFTQQDKTKHIFLTSTISATNKIKMLGVTIFEKNGNEWHIQSDYPSLKPIKSESISWHWEKIGRDNYALIETTKNEIYVYEIDNNLKELIYYKAPEKEDYADLDKSNEPWNKITNENYKFVNVDHLAIKFFDSNSQYFSILVVAHYLDGSIANGAYQFQDTKYSELKTIAFKELFGETKESLSSNKQMLFETLFNENFYTVFFRTEITSPSTYTAVVSNVTYKQLDGQWQIVSKQSNIKPLDFFGVAPSNIKGIQSLQLNSSSPMLLVDYYSSGSSFVNKFQMVLAFDDNWHYFGEIDVISTCFRLCFTEPNGEVGNPYGYTGTVSIIQSAKKFPDLLVTKKGTDYIDNKIVSAKNSLYVFNGKKYEEKKDAKVPNVKNETVAVVQDTSAAKSSVMQMIDYAVDNGGMGHESEIQEAKLKIESSPKPAKGNKKTARKINDEGLALFNKQDFDGAVAKFIEANRLDASDIEIVNNLGFAYLKQQNLDSAQQILIAALTMFPDRAAAWSNLGDVFALSGDERKAVACYANTYRFSKDMAKTHQFMKKMNAAEVVPALKQARDGAMNWAQKVYPELL